MRLPLIKSLRERFPKDKSEKELKEYREGVEPEKKDFMAMLIAAWITIVPFVLLLVLLIFVPMWLMFGR